MSWTDYEELDAARTRHGRGFRFRQYDESSQILIVTIPGGPYETLHGGLYFHCMAQIIRMDLDDHWATTGAKRHQSDINTTLGGRKGKEGDSSGGPDPERVGPGKWPTLVIEAGVSERYAVLKSDMDWWFRHSDHQVKIVILMDLDSRARIIKIEKWTEEHQGHPNLRSRPSLVPQIRQTIDIALRVDRGGNNTIDVISTPLILEFDLLFLRAPRQGEHDVVITLEKIRHMATRVFRETGMIPTSTLV